MLPSSISRFVVCNAANLGTVASTSRLTNVWSTTGLTPSSVVFTQKRDKRWWPQPMLTSTAVAGVQIGHFCSTSTTKSNAETSTKNADLPAPTKPSEKPAIIPKPGDPTGLIVADGVDVHVARLNELPPVENLDWQAAQPIYAESPAERDHFELVKADGGELVANFALYRRSIERSQITTQTYRSMSAQEHDIYFAHLYAVQKRRLNYTDPTTKLQVMTVCQLLYNGECCGNACRHCPYEQVNVPKERKRVHNGAYYV